MKSIAQFRHGHSRKARGFSLVTAIFLLVVLAGLGVAMVTISTAQQAASSLDELSSRAYQSARAGIEWALFRTPAALCPTAVTTTTSFAMPAGTSLAQFTVTVTCTSTVFPAGAPTRYRLESVACNQPAGAGVGSCPNQTGNASPDYVQRRIQVEF